MPNIKSAIKRVNVAEKKRLRNNSVKSQVSSTIKKFRAAIMSNDAPTAEALLPETFSVIDSAVSKNVIHKNNAANKKAALAKLLDNLKSGKLVITAKIDNKTRIAEKHAKEELERLEAKKIRDELREKKAAQKNADKKTPKAKVETEVKKTAKKSDAKPVKNAEKAESAEPKKEMVKKPKKSE